MKWLNQIPLFRLIIPFSLGIIGAFYNPEPVKQKMVWVLIGLTVLNLVLLKLRAIHSNYYNRWVFGVFAFIYVFFLGNTLTNFRVEKFKSTHFSNFITTEHKPSYIVGTISSEPEIKTNSIKAVVKINQLDFAGKNQPVTGKCLVYFKKTDSTQIKYGNQITFLKTPQKIDPPTNFDEFDYKRYLSHHYIYHRLYLSNLDYQIIGFNPPNLFKNKAINWRNFILHRYQKFGINGDELAILSALTLGKKESLTPQLKSAYSSAGAMHVLAVSGLHVGIIFLVVNFLLKWMDKHKLGKIIKAILLLFFVWLYAFITGLSPSVFRAATMFSFMIMALSFKRKSNIYNTLALSAFTILIIQPFMLLEVGFQLSYLAVIGIIYLHPYLYNLFTFKPWLLNQAWNITCVSLSAQLATAPLGILYFHQFPTYFLFSNLIVIPAAFIIMGVSIAFQLLSFIPYLGTGIAYLLKGIIWLLNTSVHHLEKLPSALLSGLDITVLETWLLYSILVAATIWLTQNKRKFVFVTLILILSLTISQTIEKWNQLHQKQITFYHSGKDFAIEFVNGYLTEFFADSSLISNADKMQFYIYHHWWKRGIPTETQTISIPIQKVQILGRTKILRIEDNEICSYQQVNKLKPEIIYFNSHKSIAFDSISSTGYQPIVIIGPKASKKMKSKIEKICNSKNWIYHNMSKSGAFKIMLDDKLAIKKTIIANAQ